MEKSQNPTQNVLLGVTGGIAAYKSPEIIRRLQELGITVRVVMTQSAEKFIGEVTLQAISGHPVYKDIFSSDDRVMEHIDLARWADKILIAPCSADFIAKLTHGFADNLLSTLCLAAECPIYLAPAMNQAMWHSPATQDNVEKLKSRGVEFLGPEAGSQACGEIGYGRLLEINQLVDEFCSAGKILSGKTVLITAGPTQEALDPVRFITNHSSGKMGYALAQQAQRAGAEVTLVSGPVHLPAPYQVNVVNVISAKQMYDAVIENAEQADIFIAAAAVADYSPIGIAEQKIKKSQTELSLELKKNPDILNEVSSMDNRPFCIGFAAETENLEANAKEKLARKKLDMIIANYVGQNKSGDYKGFNSDQNKVHVFTSSDSLKLPEMKKSILAKQLVELIAQTYEKKHST